METAADDMDVEQIKLVIWDLDDTFWQGTLAEGGIAPIAANIEIVKELTARGIVNSICSKNYFDAAKDALVGLGIWDLFVFPRIAFAPKGQMIQEIIGVAQLRAPSILFVDDNPLNLREAEHYNPGLQTADPGLLAGLLDDPRAKGKPDPDHNRLARYKILEEKHTDQMLSGSDNLEFLRQSQIRISFHHDVEAEFPRIHDLVNRTNQLNFTKHRWPESEADARAAFEAEFAQSFDTHCGYVKVSDRYGSYGICGFYMVRQKASVHFLFSCRSMNMGIEQFTWHKIGRPRLKIVGEVVSCLDELPDWITVVEDADRLPQEARDTRMTVCVRGACDLSMMTHYLRMHYDLIEEFPFPYMGWGIQPVARAVAVQAETETESGRALLARLPGMPDKRFASAINSREADIYVISLSAETFVGRYCSRSTGMVLPLQHHGLHGPAFKTTSFAEMRDVHRAEFTEEQWAFMQDELDFVDDAVSDRLEEDVRHIFGTLRGKIVIALLLNEKVGKSRWLLGQFGKVNALIRHLAPEYGVIVLDISNFVRSTEDLATPDDAGGHFSRPVYIGLAQKVVALIQARMTEQTRQVA